MPILSALQARQILDSRGIPTVEVTLWLDNGWSVTSSAPAGTSKGKYEAHELRDGDKAQFNGQGVLKTIDGIHTTIAPALMGKDPTQQQVLDELLIQLDGTPDKSKLGANATIAVSQAIVKAGAACYGLPAYAYIAGLAQQQNLFIPTAMYTMLNGGVHGAGNLDFQEFHLIPASYHSFSTGLNIAASLFDQLGRLLEQKKAVHSVGLVGGYTPNLYTNADGFEIMIEAGKLSNFIFSQDFFFGLDVAASEFFSNGRYVLRDKTQPYSSDDLLDYYLELKQRYRVMVIEDPFHEDDTGVWQKLTTQIGGTTTILGDNLIVTNRTRLAQSIQEKWCNSVLIKPNQIGTITESLWVAQEARAAGIGVAVSHRSGETNDDLIADLAVGLGADMLKFGPPNRGERVAKLNRLLAIEAELLQQSTSASGATSSGEAVS